MKKLLTNTWTGHVEEKLEIENWQREQMPRKWRGTGGEEVRN